MRAVAVVVLRHLPDADADRVEVRSSHPRQQRNVVAGVKRANVKGVEETNLECARPLRKAQKRDMGYRVLVDARRKVVGCRTEDGRSWQGP